MIKNLNGGDVPLSDSLTFIKILWIMILASLPDGNNSVLALFLACLFCYGLILAQPFIGAGTFSSYFFAMAEGTVEGRVKSSLRLSST